MNPKYYTKRTCVYGKVFKKLSWNRPSQMHFTNVAATGFFPQRGFLRVQRRLFDTTHLMRDTSFKLISLTRMLCFGQVCASPCAFNANAALQGAYITPFPKEVVRDEAYVSKIVCCLHVMASNPHPPPWLPRISTIFILLRLNPLGQRKLPIVILLSRMLCFGRECTSPCALNVSAALQGAYNTRLDTRESESHCYCLHKHWLETSRDFVWHVHIFCLKCLWVCIWSKKSKRKCRRLLT